MKFHKLHNQKVLFWMTKYIIMFMTQGVLNSRSESGAETRSQTFQFLLDILNKNQVVEQVSRHLDLCTLQHVVEFVIPEFQISLSK
jgi:hypothetical protein